MVARLHHQIELLRIGNATFFVTRYFIYRLDCFFRLTLAISCSSYVYFCFLDFLSSFAFDCVQCFFFRSQDIYNSVYFNQLFMHSINQTPYMFNTFQRNECLKFYV